MSKWTVEWLESAEQELAELWMNSADKAAVTQAVATIDSLLERDPMKNGTHVAEGLLKLSVPPVRVYYSIDDSQHSVEVGSVAEIS